MKKFDQFFSDNYFYIHHARTDRPYDSFDLHYHMKKYEIYYFVEGDAEFQIDNHVFRLTPDCILFVPPKVVHGVRVLSNQPFHRVALHFRSEFFIKAEQNFLLTSFHKFIFRSDLVPYNIAFYVQSILDCMNMSPEIRHLVLVSRVFSLLAQIYQFHTQEKPRPSGESERIQEVLRYLWVNLRSSLSLDTIARKFNINKDYLNTLFRKETGVTLGCYIRNKRLELAKKKIMSGYSVTDAAFDAGFNDYSTFYRAYIRYFDCSPSTPVIEPVQTAQIPSKKSKRLVYAPLILGI